MGSAAPPGVGPVTGSGPGRPGSSCGIAGRTSGNKRQRSGDVWTRVYQSGARDGAEGKEEVGIVLQGSLVFLAKP